MDLLHVIFNLLYIAVWTFILLYIIRLEEMGCECAQGWRRVFIKYYIMFIIAMVLLGMFGIFSTKELSPMLMTLQFALTIFFISVVYHYIHELKVKKCRCSENMARDILEFVNYIQIFLVIFSLLLIVHAMFAISQALSKMPLSRQKSIMLSLKKSSRK